MKIQLIPLAALGLGLLTSCNKQTEEEATPTTPAESSNKPTELKIAYVEIDSLMANYQFCKDYTEIANQEGENIQKTLAAKQRALEKHAGDMQKKYESNGFTSQEELQRAQESLQREQMDLEQLSARLTNSFQEEQAKFNDEMRDSVNSFLKQYNKTKKYDFILSKAGDNMLFASPKYDITNEVLKGLNKRYKVKPEIAAKLKKDKK
ncbi:MAG: OmpH family outer membrane protein [Bacteroidaceae bacterium]|nr:OmpH family outer membrane protein [Bacteroidaceae bacterium]